MCDKLILYRGSKRHEEGGLAINQGCWGRHRARKIDILGFRTPVCGLKEEVVDPPPPPGALELRLIGRRERQLRRRDADMDPLHPKDLPQLLGREGCLQ